MPLGWRDFSMVHGYVYSKHGRVQLSNDWVRELLGVVIWDCKDCNMVEAGCLGWCRLLYLLESPLDKVVPLVTVPLSKSTRYQPPLPFLLNKSINIISSL